MAFSDGELAFDKILWCARLLAHGLDELAGNDAPDQASMYRRKAIDETPNQHYGVVKFFGEAHTGVGKRVGSEFLQYTAIIDPELIRTALIRSTFIRSALIRGEYSGSLRGASFRGFRYEGFVTRVSLRGFAEVGFDGVSLDD